jgi:mRNA interferase RelE/StbE
MDWTILVAKAARKQLTRFPAKDQKKISDALRSLSNNPFSGDIIRLEGTDNRWRRRVGNYRIFFAVDTTNRMVASARLPAARQRHIEKSLVSIRKQ